jgi:hypothetical protein
MITYAVKDTRTGKIVALSFRTLREARNHAEGLSGRDYPGRFQAVRATKVVVDGIYSEQAYGRTAESRQEASAVIERSLIERGKPG